MLEIVHVLKARHISRCCSLSEHHECKRNCWVKPKCASKHIRPQNPTTCCYLLGERKYKKEYLVDHHSVGQGRHSCWTLVGTRNSAWQRWEVTCSCRAPGSSLSAWQMLQALECLTFPHFLQSLQLLQGQQQSGWSDRPVARKHFLIMVLE